MQLQLIPLDKQMLLKYYKENPNIFRAKQRIEILKRKNIIYSFNNFTTDWLHDEILSFQYIDNKWIILNQEVLSNPELICTDLNILPIDRNGIDNFIEKFLTLNRFKDVLYNVSWSKINTIGHLLHLYREYIKLNIEDPDLYEINLTPNVMGWKTKDLTLAIKEVVNKPFKEFLNECKFGFEQETFETEDNEIDAFEGIEHIRFHKDGSVDGHEFVTDKPLSYQQITSFAKEVIETCKENKFEINSKCSGHISISHPKIKHNYYEEIQLGLSVLSILPLFELVAPRFSDIDNYSEFYRFQASESKYTAVNHHDDYWEFRFIGGQLPLDKIDYIFETVAYSLYMTYRLRYNEPVKFKQLIELAQSPLNQILNNEENEPIEKKKSKINQLFTRTLAIL